MDELTANKIAESMYAMCDEEGNQILLFDSIVDHRKDANAMTLSDQIFVDSRGKKQYKRSTKGWEVCVQWKDGSTSWEKLADFKECYPIQTAEYAISQSIDHEPAFNNWVTHTAKTRPYHFSCQTETDQILEEDAQIRDSCTQNCQGSI